MSLDYVSRAELGWPASAAPDQTDPVLGLKIHYEGTPVPVVEHSKCAGRWTAIRNSHLANTAEGYSDVAYNWAVCDHGEIFEGRGWGKRTGANGSQALNRTHNAILWMGGTKGVVTPSKAAVTAIKELIHYLRTKGAGNEIKGHRDGYATSCPGDPMYSLVKAGKLEPTTPPKESEMTEEQYDLLKAVFKLVQYGGWDYKNLSIEPKRDAYAILREIDKRLKAVEAKLQ